MSLNQYKFHALTLDILRGIDSNDPTANHRRISARFKASNPRSRLNVNFSSISGETIDFYLYENRCNRPPAVLEIKTHEASLLRRLKNIRQVSRNVIQWNSMSTCSPEIVGIYLGH